MAVVVATGITAAGAREVLGLGRRRRRDEVFWRLPEHAEEARLEPGASGHLGPARRPTGRAAARVPGAQHSNAAGPLRTDETSGVREGAPPVAGNLPWRAAQTQP